jgi:hypothetical protein
MKFLSRSKFHSKGERSIEWLWVRYCREVKTITERAERVKNVHIVKFETKNYNPNDEYSTVTMLIQ